MENKYTVREFLKSILANENVSSQDKEMAQVMLDKLDERNEKRRNTPTKEQKENAVTKEAILSVLANGKNVASGIANTLSISTQKASALCKQLVDEGKVTVTDVKIKGKGVVKEYKLAE